MVTLKEIAEAAGVSPITVSRVLTGKHPEKVSEETRRRVLRLAKEMGYHPNIVARALREQRTYQFALVVPGADLSFIPEIIEGLQRVANDHGYACLFYLTAFRPEIEAKALDHLVAHRVDGVVWLPGPQTQPTARVLIDRPLVQLLYKELPDAAAVLVDQEHGAYLATHHLLELGHRRIGAVMVLDRHGRQRLQGYYKALKEAGVAPEAGWLITTDARWEGAKAAVRNALAGGLDVTALVCYSDVVAWGAIRALLEAGRSVPGDVSVVGFDDRDFAAHIEVPLTTIAQPRREIGERAMLHLLRLIDGERPGDVILDPSLVVRASTAPVRG